MNLPEAESTQMVRVSLQKENNTIAVIAQNRHGASMPAFVHVRWTGKAEEEGIDTRPVLRILAIGVSSYEDPDLKKGVQFASKDAGDFVNSILRQKGAFYRDIEVLRLFGDGEPYTRDDVLRGLDWIKKRATNINDVAVIFMSGHGVTDNSNNVYYFLPRKANLKRLVNTGVRAADIIDTVTYMHGKVLLFIDTCYSGSITGANRKVRTDINGFVNELMDTEKQGVVFASSIGSEKSQQVESNGAFTKALTEGLSGIPGSVKYRTNDITVLSLGMYLADRVPILTNKMQHPTLPLSLSKAQGGTDFTIGVKVKDLP